MENFRDKLVQQIKDSGQELIDRADSLVSPDLTEITDFSITINMYQEECPTISVTTEVISRTAYERLCANLRKCSKKKREK